MLSGLVTYGLDELLACCQCVLLGLLALGAGQGVEVEAQGADLAAQLLTGLSPARTQQEGVR